MSVTKSQGSSSSRIQKINTSNNSLVASGGTFSSFVGNGTNGRNQSTYNVHTFTSNGNFTISSYNSMIDVLMVGAGGSGGFDQGGGGGAGGVMLRQLLISRPCTISVVVGQPVTGGSGGDTSITSNITNNIMLVSDERKVLTSTQNISGSPVTSLTVLGGGRGGQFQNGAGLSGGSGGGGSNQGGAGAGTSGQGTNGSTGGGNGFDSGHGGGGGGSWTGGSGVTGGNGIFSDIIGSNVGYAAGGGGGGTAVGNGGNPGGGNGAATSSGSMNATTTGSGGGGGQFARGNGSAGIVVFRYIVFL